MKNQLMAACSLIVMSLSTQAFAQKYVTRSGNVSFSSKTPVENIEAINHEASAALNAATGDVQAVVPIKSFKFRQDLMQEHFNENYMESTKFPKAEYKGRITNMSEVDKSKDGTYNVKTVGKLTIHGVTRDVAVPGTITVKQGAMALNATFNVKCADYGISVPSVVSSKIAENIAVTLSALLVAAK